ncbi:hypothetical protein ACX6XY_09525 [Streptomyces sp. O3]
MTRRHLTDEQCEFIEQYLPVGTYCLGRTGLSPVNVGFTTVRAHHHAAGTRVDTETMPDGKSGDASGESQAPAARSAAWQVWRAD